MEQSLTENTKGLTIKRVLICSAVTGVVAFAADRVSEVRRSKARDDCFARFRNVNQALVLYRGDADGFSPVYARREINRPELKLARYDGGKSLACPYDPRFDILSLRLAVGGAIKTTPIGSHKISIMSMFGIEDNSVVADCENHLKYKFRIKIPGSPPTLADNAPPIGGTYVVLLRSGSAKVVPYDTKLEQWLSRDGKFVRPVDRPKSWTGYANSYIFDFEPSPPQYER